MTGTTSIKIAIAVTFCLAAAVFVSMAVMQKLYALDHFRFGAPFPSYSADDVRRALAAEPEKAAFEIFPILFLFDLLFLASAAAFLALFSIAYAPASLPFSWLWLLVLPGLYLIGDFTENALLAGMLSDKSLITDRAVSAAHFLTSLKWAGFALASIQAIGIFVWSCVAR